MSHRLKATPIHRVLGYADLFQTVRKHLKWVIVGLVLFFILMAVIVIGGLILLSNLLLRPALEQVPQLQQQGTNLLQQGQQMIQNAQGLPQQQEIQQVQQQLNEVQRLLEERATPAASEGDAEPAGGRE